MARISLPTEVDCPHCQARSPAAADRCQACGKTLAIYIGPAEHFPRRLDLGSLMLLIALIAVCLGATREVPALGFLLMLLFVPALLRTFVWTARIKGDGRPLLWPETLGAFAASVGIVWLIALGAIAAFAIAFTLGAVFVPAILALTKNPLNWDPDALFASIPLGFVAGGIAVYHLGKALWPIKD